MKPKRTRRPPAGPRETWTLTTRDGLTAAGEAIATAPDGRVVFVAGAAPNEHVRADVSESKPRFARAVLTEVLTASPARVEPRCPHYAECGGCVLQHVDPDVQRESKQAHFRDQLQRLGGTSLEPETPWASAPYGFRQRVRFLAYGGALGYRAAKSHRFVPVQHCPVLVPELEALLQRTWDGTGELSALWAGALAYSATFAGASENDPLPVDDGFGPLWLSPAVFSQSNGAGNQALLGALAEWLDTRRPARVLELYSGSGNLTRVIAARAEVIAVETHAPAVALSERSLPAVTHWALTAEAALERAESIDAVVVDPPRAGLSTEVLEGLGRLAPADLFYVSCDPATFARDVRRLSELGLNLIRTRLFDFYPQTAHAEVLGIFTR